MGNVCGPLISLYVLVTIQMSKRVLEPQYINANQITFKILIKVEQVFESTPQVHNHLSNRLSVVSL